MDKALYIKSLRHIIIYYLCVQSLILLAYVIRLEADYCIFFSLGLTVGFLIMFIYFDYYFKKYSTQFNTTAKDQEVTHILYNLMKETAHISDTNILYDKILEGAIQAINNADRGCITLLDPETNRLHFVASKGFNKDLLKSTYIELEQSYLYRESHQKIEHSLIINEPFEYSRQYLPDDNIAILLDPDSFSVHTTISAPIFIDDSLYGMINVDSETKNAFTEMDVQILEMFKNEMSHVIKHFNAVEQHEYTYTHDPLTGLPNRQSMIQLLDQFIANESVDTFCLIDVDVRKFSKINATYSYEGGDHILRDFSLNLKAIFPDECIISRYGDDEFLIYIPEYDLSDSRHFMDKLKNRLHLLPIKLHKSDIHIEFNYKIASYPIDGLEVRQLLKKADLRQ